MHQTMLAHKATTQKMYILRRITSRLCRRARVLYANDANAEKFNSIDKVARKADAEQNAVRVVVVVNNWIAYMIQ